jgi:hypothetical protein
MRATMGDTRNRNRGRVAGGRMFLSTGNKPRTVSVAPIMRINLTENQRVRLLKLIHDTQDSGDRIESETDWWLLEAIAEKLRKVK